MDTTTLLYDRAEPAGSTRHDALTEGDCAGCGDTATLAVDATSGQAVCSDCELVIEACDNITARGDLEPEPEPEPEPWPDCDTCGDARAIDLHVGWDAWFCQACDTRPRDTRTDADGWPLCLPDDRIPLSDDEPLPPPPPPPDVLGVIYSDKTNVIAGEPGGGKTILLLACAAHIVKVLDQRLVWLDAEDSPAVWSERMAWLGHRDLTRSPMVKRINHTDWIDADALDRAAASAWLTDGDSGTGHLVIDSGTATESGTSAEEYAAWIKRHAVHVGMTTIEHVAKNPEMRFGPLGSTRKNQAATGITAMIEGAAWTPAKPAAVNLRVVKDRPGGTGRQKGELYATVHGDPHPDGSLTITVRPPLEESAAYAGLIDAAVRDDPGIGANALRDAVTEAAKITGLRSDWQTVVAEIKEAVRSGLIEKRDGKGRRVHHYPADHSE